MVIGGAESSGGRPIILLGLSRRNIEQLMAGYPVRVTPETHRNAPIPDVEILILFGETEDSIRQDMADAGIIDAGTKVEDARCGPKKKRGN